MSKQNKAMTSFSPLFTGFIRQPMGKRREKGRQGAGEGRRGLGPIKLAQLLKFRTLKNKFHWHFYRN